MSKDPIYFHILLRSAERKSGKVGLRLSHNELDGGSYFQRIHYVGSSGDFSIVDEEFLRYYDYEVKGDTSDHLDKYLFAILEELNYPIDVKIIDFKCPFKIEVPSANTLWHEQGEYLEWDYIQKSIRTSILGIIELKYEESL